MADPTTSEIAAALDELGDLSELDGAVIHRIVAYRNAAKTVRDASVSVSALEREGRATELPGLGPKRARRLYDELSVDSLDALAAAATGHRIRELKGFGPKAEDTLLAA